MNRRDLLLGGAGAWPLCALPLSGLASCTTAEPPLRVAVNGWIGYAPLFLAQDLGHVPENTVRLVEFPSNTASMMALVNREVAAAALTLDELLAAREGGLQVRAAMVFDESCGADVVMAHPRIDSLAALRGKRLGVESTAVGALMLSRLLAAASLTPTDLVKVPLTADQHVAAYAAGDIDAVITFEPMASRLRDQGAHALLDSSHFPGLIVDVLAVAAGTSAQQAAPPAGGRRAVGATTAGNDAYPTDDQWKNSKEAQALVAKAKSAAGSDPILMSRFDKSCPVLGPQRPAVLRQSAGLAPEPQRVVDIVKIFDNLYYFGYNTVGAWAIPTSQGIVLIDALNNVDEAEHMIEAGLVKVGLKPADVKMIIVGHGHFDHFGGAPQLRAEVGADILTHDSFRDHFAEHALHDASRSG